MSNPRSWARPDPRGAITRSLTSALNPAPTPAEVPSTPAPTSIWLSHSFIGDDLPSGRLRVAIRITSLDPQPIGRNTSAGSRLEHLNDPACA